MRPQEMIPAPFSPPRGEGRGMRGECAGIRVGRTQTAIPTPDARRDGANILHPSGMTSFDAPVPAEAGTTSASEIFIHAA
jgi:hypothetical protein